jgi:hypothetical protein
MKLWLISQHENTDYDTYDSAVVAALTAADAQRIIPGSPSAFWGADGRLMREDSTGKHVVDRFAYWAFNLSKVHVELIGEAKDGIKEGAVICASFNAG